jgi:hypothetical protein
MNEKPTEEEVNQLMALLWTGWTVEDIEEFYQEQVAKGLTS